MPQSVTVAFLDKDLQREVRRMLEIIYKNTDFVAVRKAPGVPSQRDTSGDSDAITVTEELLAQSGEKSDLWLVHRLDRVVGGVLVFARNKNAAALLSTLVSRDGMGKEYLAIVEGRAPGEQMRDYLYKDAKKAKAFVVDRARAGAKEAVLEYEPLCVTETERGERTLVRIKLHTGRFHQIRAQFSKRGMPIVGDGKYGSHDNRAKMPALFSARLSFSFKDKSYEFSSLPDIKEYPWSIFSEEFYK